MRTNLVLAAVLIVLCLVVALVPEPQRKVTGVPLFDDGVDIALVEVFRNQELRFALRKHANGWRIAGPYDLPADDFQIDALLGALHKPSVRYPMTEMEPAQAGLVDIEWQLHVNGAVLNLGGRTAIGNMRYLQKDGHVHLVDERFVYQLQRNPLDYISRRLLPPTAVLGAIQLPSGTRIEKFGNGWRPVPEDRGVSADAMQAVASAWKNAIALDVGNASSVPRDGDVLIEFEGGEKLRFGVEVRDNALLLSRAEPALTYTLPRAAMDELLPVKLNHFRDNEIPE